MAFPEGWTRKAPITIDATRIGGSSGALSDFPVLVTAANLPSEMFDSDGASPAQNGGGDIRFTSDEAGTNAIPLEVVSFVTDPDPANGQAELWVKVPSLDKGADTTIWVWWKTAGTDAQPAVTDAIGRNAVWADFTGVWHFESATADTDVTGNGHDTTITTTGALGPGPWGNAVDFAGGGQNADTGEVAAFDFGSVPFTFWIVARPRDGVRRDLMSNRANNAGYEYRLEGDNSLAVGIVGNTPNFQTSLSVSSDQWHWLGFSTDGAGNGRGFVDGTSETGTHAHPDSSGGPFVIAAENPSGETPLPGEVAFAAVLPVAWGDDEFNTWFNNQSAPASFATAGTVQDVGGATAISGAVASTLAGLSAAATGRQRFGGEAGGTTAPLRLAAMGGLANRGTAGGVTAGLIAEASSSADIAGSASATAPSPSAGASGRLRHAGSGSPTIAATIFAAAGDIGSTGALAAVIRAATAAAAGSVAGVQSVAPGRLLETEPGVRTRTARKAVRTLATSASQRTIE